YESFRSGQPARLPELPIQYRDFAQWQREWLQGEVLEKQLSYWRERLVGAPAALQLWTDHPRPTQPTHGGAREAVVLTEVLTTSLAALNRREGTTLFMTLLAALQVLLHRYTGQTDLCVGSLIANRSKVDTHGLIGFFVNTLVMRADLSGDPSFREVLRRVREDALEAYAHQDLPFQKLAEELEPERSLSHSPLFQVMFVLQNAPSESLPLAGVSARASEIDTGTAKLDLTVSLEESSGCITGWVEYSTDLFEAETIRRMVGHFKTLLASAVQDPDQRISALRMLTQPERQHLLVEWNNTRREYPRRCVHELFEEQAERTPNAMAVTLGDQGLTYHELNQRANRLARRLRRLGVDRETRVGICAERSPELVVGLLGILKAGGAYVPLDPAYPKERLAFMIEDTEAQVLLSQNSLKAQLPASRARVFVLDEFLESTGNEDEPNPSSGVTPENLVYIMYTSGSTGRPKGVEVVHRGIVRLLFGTDFARLGESEVILQRAPISFDASTFEIWGALLHGGRCVLFPKRTPTAEELGSELKKQGVNTVWLTASLFNAVMDEAPLALSGVRQLLVGGEALSVPHVRRALELLPATQLVNGYGPTESTTFTCCYKIPPALDTHDSPIPIGRPIANTQVHILDSHLQPVPIGVAGELHVGGDGLARGYLNQSELTAEKFIHDPFRGEAEARLYKTGDLARYWPDGNIEFLGRLDHQVKIRGYRVELGEIEAVLGQYPAVKTTAVVLREDAPGDRRLVAYVVLKQGESPTTEELRSFLGRRLPEFMLPSRIEFLQALPLTPSGKANRGALPEPGESRPEVGQAFVAPRTELEEELARIWCGVLRLDEVGIHDNFFDLGGHSLLATRLMARVEKAFGKTLPLAALFQAPTIQHLAALLSEKRKLEAIPGIVPIQPAGWRAPFFCVGAGPLFRPLAQRLGPDQPFLGLGLGEEDIQSLPAPFRLEDMAAVLVRKVREIQPAGPYFLGGWCADGVLAYETARQLLIQGEALALLVLFDAPNPNPSADGSNSKGSEWRRLFRRIRHHHFKNLRRVTMPERLDYLRHKLRTRMTILKHTSWEVSYKLRLYATGNINGLPRVFNSMEYFAVRHYRPRIYAGRVLLIQANTPLEALSMDPEMGWGDVVPGGLEIYSAPGGHQGMFMEPHVDTLADKLGAYLVEAQATFTTSRPAALS
ncbi:MAG TPA: amino acid adenylation domain-containing protein, partial [Terriglobia bacterium]|nr:amino acid adenylation domain-containing protein [Terriglobia bacterium]